MAVLTEVHQFHPSTAIGDAITGDMLEIQNVLRHAGFSSEIFTQHVAPGLEKVVRPLSHYPAGASSLLLVHHSMGFDGFDDRSEERRVGKECRSGSSAAYLRKM